VEGTREFELDADGEWHEAHLDLYGTLRDEDRKADRLVAESVLVGEWAHTGYKEITAVDPDERGVFELTDVRLRSAAGSTRAELEWSDPPDRTGIAEYAFLLDAAPRTIPEGTGQGKVNRASLEAPPGEYVAYFHLRARDGAGNWGDTAHYPITVDGAGPIASHPSPQPDSEAWDSQIRAVLSDPGSGVEPDSIRLSVDGIDYDVRGGGLFYDGRSGTLAFLPWAVEPPPRAWPAGKRVRVVLAAASDYAGNPLREPLAWSYTIGRATAGAGEPRMITAEGGIEPAWSVDGTRIAYVVETPARALHVLERSRRDSRGSPRPRGRRTAPPSRSPRPISPAGVTSTSWTSGRERSGG
jgi:hypothetical protein